MSDIRMPEVRFIPAEGPTQIVQTRGGLLRPNNHYYDPATHKGHMQCLHCETDVFFRSGSPSTNGGRSPGRVDHFVVNGEHSADCLLPLRLDGASDQQVDHTKGYLLKINTLTYSSLFNEKAFDQIENGDDLQDREAFIIHGVEDIIKFIRRGEKDRLKDSKILYMNRVESWMDFFVRYENDKGHHRFKKLLKTLDGLGPDDQSPHIVMEVRTDRPHTVNRYSSRQPATSKAIYLETNENGQKVFLTPSVFIGNVHNTHVSHAFMVAGTYLVMGTARLGEEAISADGNAVFKPLNITIKDPSQVVSVNMSELENEARKAARRRQGIPAPAPESVPA